MNKTYSYKYMDKLQELIEQNLGIQCDEHKMKMVNNSISRIVKNCRFSSISDWMEYILHLKDSVSLSQELIQLLDINETYFYREKSSLLVLEHEILPRLIHDKLNTTREIYIWCAGCSTGEEPYTVAMILSDILSDIDQWNIHILATDINPVSLEKASCGIFRNWSFRDQSTERFKKYFTSISNSELKINDKIKKYISFQRFNLNNHDARAFLPYNQTMDIIFCRNVLMYFTPAYMRDVLSNLVDSLRDGGWLINSLSEISFISHPNLHAISFPDCILFQKNTLSNILNHNHDQNCSFKNKYHDSHQQLNKRIHNRNTSKQTTNELKNFKRNTHSSDTQIKLMDESTSMMCQATKCFERGEYSKVITLLEKDHSNQSVLMQIRSYTNLQDIHSALLLVQNLIEHHPLNDFLYYILGIITYESGKILKSIDIFKKVIYLNNNHILAHFYLGNLYYQQSEYTYAKRHMSNVQMLLLTNIPVDLHQDFNIFTKDQILKISKLIYEETVLCEN